MYRVSITNLNTGSTGVTSYSHATEAERNFKIAARSLLCTHGTLIFLRDHNGHILDQARREP